MDVLVAIYLLLVATVLDRSGGNDWSCISVFSLHGGVLVGRGIADIFKFSNGFVGEALSPFRVIASLVLDGSVSLILSGEALDAVANESSLMSSVVMISPKFGSVWF